MTAVSLQQMMNLALPAMTRFVIETAVRASPVARRLPFEDIDQLSITAPYLSNLPTPVFRHVNEASSEVTVDFAQISQSLSIMDYDIKIDPITRMIKGTIQNTQQAQTENAVKASMYFLVNKYVNGSVVSDAREYDGLKRTLGENPRFYGQTLNASANSTELNLAVGTAVDADYRNFFHKLNMTMALINLGGGLPQDGEAFFLSNWNALLTIEAALKQLKLYNTAADQYDREFMTYKGINFLDAGWTASGAVAGSFPAGGAAGDLVIGNDSEAVTATNGGNTYDKQTPIYIVRQGRQYNMGIQLAALSTKDMGQETASPHYFVYNVLWANNPAALWQKRAAARLVGCNFSGVTS